MFAISGINLNNRTSFKVDKYNLNSELKMYSQPMQDSVSFKGFKACGCGGTGEVIKLVETLKNTFSEANHMILEARTKDNRLMHLSYNPDKQQFYLKVSNKRGFDDFSNAENYKNYEMKNDITIIDDEVKTYLKSFVDKFRL